MDANLKAKWVEELRSDKYQQVAGALHRPTQGYCCLGVLAVVMGATFEYRDGEWWPVIDGRRIDMGHGDEYLAPSCCGIAIKIQEGLAIMNDDRQPFSTIADHIEANL